MCNHSLTRREAMRLGSAGLLSSALASPLLATLNQAEGKKVLYCTKSSGFEHSVVKRTEDRLSYSEKILVEVGKRYGFEVTPTKDGRVFDGDHEKYDAYIFYTSGDLTKVGPDGAPAMSAKGKQALLDAVRGGKGFLGIHAASDTFHSKGPGNKTQPIAQRDEFIQMIGGEFISHGAQQPATMRVADQEFPGFADLGASFRLHEEWYAHKNFAPDLHVLLVNETEGMKGDVYRRPPFPATWARRHERGHVLYTSMGHREDVWTNPLFLRMLLGAVNWVTGVVAAQIPANMDQVTPQANQLAG
jgi:type 1 glutamine amidotransferase